MSSSRIKGDIGSAIAEERARPESPIGSKCSLPGISKNIDGVYEGGGYYHKHNTKLNDDRGGSDDKLCRDKIGEQGVMVAI